MAFKDGVVIGPVSFNASGSANTSIGTGTNSGTVSIGNTSSALISIDCGTAGITVGTTSNAHATTFGSTNSSSSTTVQSGSGTLSVASSNGNLTVNSGTGTLGISTDSSSAIVNIGTGGGAKTVTLGSTSSTGTTNLQGGSGGVVIPQFTQGAVVTSSAGLVSSVTGTAGYWLTSNGASTAPSFQVGTTGPSDAFVFLQKQTASSSANITFTSTYITSTYKNYFVTFNGIATAGSPNFFTMAISDDNGSTYKNSSYIGGNISNATSGTTWANSNITTIFRISASAGNTFNSYSGYMFLYNLGLSSNLVLAGQVIQRNAAAVQSRVELYGLFTSTSTINNIQFAFDSSVNIDSGTITLYGITT